MEPPNDSRRFWPIVLSIISGLLVLGISGTIVTLTKHAERLSGVETEIKAEAQFREAIDKRLDRIEMKLDRVSERLK